MAHLYLVRHGRAAAGWGDDLDPGLDDVGVRQAETAAGTLSPLGPLPMIVSPLRRTRETAGPLERAWGVTAVVDPRVGEIESPGLGLSERGVWLRQVMSSSWSDLDQPLKEWRQQVIDALAEPDEDTVVVTHFIAINVAVGAATGDDRVVHVTPDNASITTLDNGGGRLSVVEIGGQAQTQVN
jgi:broad specificity phosphatase PhoE